MKFLIAGAGLLALAAGAALAQDAGAPPPSGARRPQMQPIARTDVQSMIASRFAEIDADRDGAVTRAEFDAYTAQRRAAREGDRREHRDRAFAKLDANRDGALSKQEFDTPPGKGDAPPPPGPGGHGGMHGHGGPGGMIGMGPHWFDEADANHDGKVTLAEAQTAVLARFDRLDANRDGQLTPDEMMKGMWAMHGRRGGPDGEMPPPPGQ